MNNALEYFQMTPHKNCAQSVAMGCGFPELEEELAACGGGRAPGGRCGALHAALRITPEDKHEAIIKGFVAETGSELCKEIKTVCKTPCTKCVEVAAALAEKELGK